MSNDKKSEQQELMKKFLEEKRSKDSQENNKNLRPLMKTNQSTKKAKHSYNGGGFFDK